MNTIFTVTTINMIFGCRMFAESDISIFPGISLQMIDTLLLLFLYRVVYHGPSMMGLRFVYQKYPVKT